MSAVDLLEPILKGGLQRNNFFNGRLFSAEDLRVEQASTDLRVGLVARAAGDGVGWGLDVSVASIGPNRPSVTITRGLAINRLGNLLQLADDAEVALVPAENAVAEATGLFAACEPPRPTGSLRGYGAYVLAIAPSSGFSGSALVSDPNTTAVGRGACGARFTVEGIRFRLVPIALATLSGIGDALRAQLVGLLPPPAGNVALRERLRNLLAHLCFGTQALGFSDAARKTAIKPVVATWGVLDAMRDRGDLTDCDVPLAVVVLTDAGISFVDMWAARRRLLDAAAVDAWRAVAGPRRIAEGEAAFLQFQTQLDIVKTQLSPNHIAALTYFDVLPPGGWLPTDSTGFDWRTFLGPHAPPTVTPIDASLLRAVIERSWFDEPFALATNPPVPLRVYQVPEQASGGDAFVVFARSENGNIRVFLSPVPGANQSVEVTATADTGAATRAASHQGGTYLITELVPGLQHVAVTAPDYVGVTPQDATAIGGRTVDLAFTLTPLPNGSILVDAVDEKGAHINDRVRSITASDGAGVTRDAAFQSSTGQWLIEDLPPATYQLTGSASGYDAAAKSGVGPTLRGQITNTKLVFKEQVREHPQPSQCFLLVPAERFRLAAAKVCLVLKATEFDERYYYNDKAYTRATTKTSDKVRMASRSKARSTRNDRYAIDTGEIIYTVEPWEGMASFAPTDSFRAWLIEWQAWFADEFDDKRILDADVRVFVDKNYHTPRSVNDIPIRPQAYAVFGRFGVPMAIEPVDRITKGPVEVNKEDIRGIREEVINRLYDAGIRYINDLAYSWQELIVDATGYPPEDVKYLINDAGGAIDPINQDRRYLPGVDKDTAKAIKDLGYTDDVALANADVDKLAEKVGSRGFAERIVAEARRNVPEDSWSLGNLGLNDSQVGALHDRGIKSKGDLAAAAGRDQGKTIIAEALGVDRETPATRDAAITAVANEAVATMTLSSVALIPQLTLSTWAGVDAVTAGKLAGAGIASVDALAAAKPEDVATAANLTPAAANKLVDDAKAASTNNISVGNVASLSPAESKALKESFGDQATLAGIAAKSPADLSAAFGGDVAKATAVLTGIKAGLTGARGFR